MSERSDTLDVENSFNVIAWNILLHRDFPQAERFAACAHKLIDLNKELSVVSLFETEVVSGRHTGEVIAELTGNAPGGWYQHNRKREYAGMFGSRVGGVESVDLGYKKKAVITKLGEISIAGVHLKYQLHGSERADQMSILLDRMHDESHAVIMGDFNCLPWQRPRRMIEAAGYRSVFEVLDEAYPRTVPTPGFKSALPFWKQIAVGKGLAIDDVYVKNVQVIDAGSFVGESDHAGVWATLSGPI